jgi:anti-sigma-K factor RskA
VRPYTVGVNTLADTWDNITFWRRAAAVLAAAALALLTAAAIARDPPDFSERPVIAVVRDTAQRPVWAIRLARGAHQIAADTLRPQPLPSDRSYQLWLSTAGAAAPRPLGLLPEAGRKVMAVVPELAHLLGGEGELVVTLEPVGGSPTPQPTGPTLFRGNLDGLG